MATIAMHYIARAAHADGNRLANQISTGLYLGTRSFMQVQPTT